MPHAFVRLVVQVQEQGFPVGRKRTVVDGETVILRSNICLVRIHQEHGLVVAAVPVFQFVGVGSGGKGKELVSEADAVDRDRKSVV